LRRNFSSPQFKDGDFNRNVFLTIAHMIVEGDEEKMKHAAKVADKCGDAKGSRCEQAFVFTTCVKDAILSEEIDVQIV
jgi:hypothetical protein